MKRPIRYSLHASDVMNDRGIDEQQVEQAIKRGSKHKQGKNKIVATYKYFAAIYKEREDGTIFVITIKPAN